VSPAPAPTVLVVDDEAGILETLRILLKNEGFTAHTALGGRAGIDALDVVRPDIVLSDIRMPTVSGLEVLAAVKERDPQLPVVLMTAQASMQSAIQAVNDGAYYYIQKPFRNDELVAILRRAAETRQLKIENVTLKQEIQRRDRNSAVRPVGRSRAWMRVLELVETVAPTDSTVLVTGESGTGKEVIARYLHDLSPRAGSAFMSINCGALPESLLESELFGHVKGAFTGAVKDKTGLFMAAQKGTFFLDEIGETTAATQVKLLRVLQQREVIPVGGTESQSIDVRMIAATNRDLEDEIRKGAFRGDLYYRLNVISVHLPPLRDRREDVPVLAESFLANMASQRGTEPHRLSAGALDALQAYDWPGNVRELENAIERAVILASGSTIEPDALPERVTSRKVESLVAERTIENPSLEAIERAYIMWVLQSEGGNKTRAAATLGIDASTLYRKLARYGLDG
jgi:DNA-binding NtrC family response regulator